MTAPPRDIIEFWVKVVGEEKWFAVEPALDDVIRARYRSVWDDARAGKLSEWAETAEGALALLIVLDQFPRNMFRDMPDAFATDAQARVVADRALARDFDAEVPENLRQFFYMPFMHSENVADQNRSVVLFGERLGVDTRNYPYALSHRDQIVRFGRFPSRNKALGRISTQEEIEYLARQT